MNISTPSTTPSTDPRRAVIVLAAALLAVDVVRAVVATDFPLVTRDAGFFQHAGWYVATQGATPYVDVWMLNPPAAVGSTTLIAALAGGHTVVGHWVAVATTIAAALVALHLVGAITAQLTGDRWAGAAAGVVFLAVPGVHGFPAYGFGPKFLALAFGLAGVYLALTDRPLGAGAAGALAAAYWQFGVVLAVSGAVAARDRLLRFAAGAGVVAGAVGLALLAWGAVEPAIVETVVAPLVASESIDLWGRVEKFVYLMGPGAPVAVGGLLFAGYVTLRERRWWLGIAAAGYLFQVAVVDFDWLGDLLFLGAVGAIGAGVAVASVPRLRSRPRVVGAVLVVLLVWSVIRAPSVPHGYGTHYWAERIPENCHYQLGGTERQWLDVLGHTPADRCGVLPGDSLREKIRFVWDRS